MVIDYCQKFDYIKVMSTISFPAAHNMFMKNVTSVEYTAFQEFNLQNDIKGLRTLLVYCKALQVEALYEMTSCAIACFFKSHTTHQLQAMLNINPSYNQQFNYELIAARQEKLF